MNKCVLRMECQRILMIMGKLLTDSFGLSDRKIALFASE